MELSLFVSIYFVTPKSILMRKIVFYVFLILFSARLYSQQYDDYLGAGHSKGITVSSSSAKSVFPLDYVAKPENTVNGNGMDAKKMEASRFLMQSTLGYEMKDIDSVVSKGIENWLDEQLSFPYENYLDLITENHEIVNNWQLNHGIDSSDLNENPNWANFMYSWWEYNMFNNDLVRQRVALALSEILVTSFRSDLSGFGSGMASYYDIFSKNAFGNYKDILKEVSYHPCMGFYLSHFNNPKAVPEENIHPDENFAREIMQLFSIGLNELNDDGSYITDNQGHYIPTYTNNDIKELAKVFTGLGPGKLVPNQWTNIPQFGIGIWITDMTEPMHMFNDYHEPGTKILLDGYTIPAGGDGDADINTAIDHLFNHHNVGPFVCKQLIQKLVKSNPSPAYVARVTGIFNNNGSGVKGDLKAVIKAILLDPEARECQWIDEPSNGKLKEPILRYTQFTRACDKDQPYGFFYNIGWNFLSETGQMVMFSPSVFNFFLPNYQPVGPLAENGLVGPEFQIHNSKTSIGYINNVFYWTRYGFIFDNWLEDQPYVFTDFYKLAPKARDPEVILNYFDVLYMAGQLSDTSRNIIKNACKTILNGDFKYTRATLASYLMLISPDFNIQK